MSHPSPKRHPELKQAQWGLAQLLNHHITKCDKHPEHAAVVEHTTGICLVCEAFHCMKCGASEEFTRDIDDLRTANLEVIDGYFCDFMKQGDQFNKAHEACADKHLKHIH